MPTITVPDDLYDRLSRRAAALNTTTDALALPALERAAAGPLPAVGPAGDATARLAAWMAAVEARAGRYPPGHTTDVSRDSVYEGCGI